MENKPNIFEYFDYRKFLKDFFQWKKANTPSFSHRAFAQKAGYSSSSYYANVVSGVHKLSETYIPRFIKGLSFNQAEGEFLILLIHFQHSSNEIEKQKYFDEIVNLKPYSENRINSSKSMYYKDWYTPVIHQILNVLNFDDDYKELAFFLSPSITVKQARESILLLRKLNLISKDENGFYKPNDNILVGGPEVGIFQIRKFQKDMMDKAKESLDDVAPKDRCIVTNTITTDSKGVQQIKNMINSLQKNISLAVEEGEDHSSLYQFNVQFFPLTKLSQAETHD
ncbi:TIGR02147 family protein [bacterium]|nr:TIGR02147 family protein [bacterium]